MPDGNKPTMGSIKFEIISRQTMVIKFCRKKFFAHAFGIEQRKRGRK